MWFDNVPKAGEIWYFVQTGAFVFVESYIRCPYVADGYQVFGFQIGTGLPLNLIYSSNNHSSWKKLA